MRFLHLQSANSYGCSFRASSYFRQIVGIKERHRYTMWYKIEAIIVATGNATCGNVL